MGRMLVALFGEVTLTGHGVTPKTIRRGEAFDADEPFAAGATVGELLGPALLDRCAEPWAADAVLGRASAADDSGPAGPGVALAEAGESVEAPEPAPAEDGAASGKAKRSR